jgi:hypothetical protein
MILDDSSGMLNSTGLMWVRGTSEFEILLNYDVQHLLPTALSVCAICYIIGHMPGVQPKRLAAWTYDIHMDETKQTKLPIVLKKCILKACRLHERKTPSSPLEVCLPIPVVD